MTMNRKLTKMLGLLTAAMMLFSLFGIFGSSALVFRTEAPATAVIPETVQAFSDDDAVPDENSTFYGTAQVEVSYDDKASPSSYRETGSGANEYDSPNYRFTGFKEIVFDEMFPAYLSGTSSWDPMGIDDNGIIYFGYTCDRSDLGVEDFAVFSYNPELDEVKFLGSFIESSRAANNYNSGESIPKGHTKFYCINGKMYLASQSFHDFKQQIDGYTDYRGAHLYAYDIAKEVLVDVSADMPNGVWCEHEGVVAMNYMEETGKLVGFTHPLANLVFYDVATGSVDRFVQGIPWALGNPLSREIIISGDKVYLYRGVEDPGTRAAIEWPVYCYDYSDDTLTDTGYTMAGGFWNGQATTSDGKTTYISGCCGLLYKLDHDTGAITFLRDMDLDGYNSINYVYSISLSPDETKLFYIPTSVSPGQLLEYDIATNGVTRIGAPIKGVYCGSNIVGNGDWYYFTRFGNQSGDWTGIPRLVAFRLEPWE